MNKEPLRPIMKEDLGSGFFPSTKSPVYVLQWPFCPILVAFFSVPLQTWEKSLNQDLNSGKVRD